MTPEPTGALAPVDEAATSSAVHGAGVDAHVDGGVDARVETSPEPLGDSAHERYMGLALAQARLAWERGEVPVGAVVVEETIRKVIVSSKG